MRGGFFLQGNCGPADSSTLPGTSVRLYFREGRPNCGGASEITTVCGRVWCVRFVLRPSAYFYTLSTESFSSRSPAALSHVEVKLDGRSMTI
jgi:hypothetical protein